MRCDDRGRRAGSHAPPAATRWKGTPWRVALLLAVSMATARADDGFAVFMTQWREALVRRDAVALASLAQTPFLFDGRAQDEAGVARVVVPALITDEVRACLLDAVPVAEDDRQVLFCAPYAFYLGRVAGRWRWVEFAADGEP